MRPPAATNEQTNTARKLNARIGKATTLDEMKAIRSDVRAAYSDRRLTMRQYNTIRDKFQWRAVYTLKLEITRP
jgi:hypothetical protein